MEARDLPGPFTALNRETNEIRLLRLLPAQSDDNQIRCTLRTFSLESSPSFTALSYEWGSDNADDEIVVNGSSVLVRKNLWHFLNCATNQQEVYADLIWIDALCIDQNKNEERSHQVSLMANIYMGAKLVIAWLGPGSDESNLALDSLEPFVNMSKSLQRTTIVDVEVILRLCYLEYWSRLWVLQELVLAEACIMFIGRRSIPMNSLEALMGHAAFALSGVTEVVNGIPEVTTWRRLLQSPAASMLRQRHHDAKQTPLLRRVIAAGNLECSETKDKIYALLGISQHVDIWPDYGISISSLCNKVLRDSQDFNSCINLQEVFEISKQLANAAGIDCKTLFTLDNHGSQHEEDTGRDTTTYPLIHRPSGICFWWLQAHGHTQIQQLWIREANDEVCQALNAASSRGHEKMVQMLLDAGADVDAQGGHFGNALQTASAENHERIVQMLLYAGADVDAQGGHYGNALQTASAEGHEKIVQMLLYAGADIDAQGGEYGNALQAASARGHEKVVKMLLDTGADVDAQGGRYSNALSAASAGGYEEVVEILLDAGADVDAQGGHDSNALQAASIGGYEKVVQMLLDAGADVNAQGGWHGNALQEASARGYEKIVQVLLDAGADVNAQEGHFSSALQAALERGYEKIVKMLLDAGADADAQRWSYSSALRAASAGGYEKLVKMLLDTGADVNAQGGWYSNALQEASAGGYEKVIEILLDAGADVNAQGGHYGNALQAASAKGYENVVKILLDIGADVDAQGGRYSNALQAALERGHKKIVQMLLDAGAGVNAQGSRYGNTLQEV